MTRHLMTRHDGLEAKDLKPWKKWLRWPEDVFFRFNQIQIAADNLPNSRVVGPSPIAGSRYRIKAR